MFSRKEGNTVEKGEIACFEHVLFFPQCSKGEVVHTHKFKGLFGKGLIILRKGPLENILGKEELAGNQCFLLFPQNFLPFMIVISSCEYNFI